MRQNQRALALAAAGKPGEHIDLDELADRAGLTRIDWEVQL